MSSDAARPHHGRADRGPEPTARRETLFEMVRGLQARGIAIIYISHRMDEVFALADRVTVLRDGQTVRLAADRRGHARNSLVRELVGRTSTSLTRALRLPHPAYASIRRRAGPMPWAEHVAAAPATSRSRT